MNRSTQASLCLFTSILFSFITSCSYRWTNSSYEQCKTLFALKAGVDDPYNTLSSWINGSNYCGWKGVGCDVITEVVTLNISFAGLNGTVNEGLFELKSFVHLNLSNNEFRGGIPKTIGSLQRLKYLNVANSGFSGVIPPHLANLSRFHFLDLSFSGAMGYDHYLKSEDLSWLKNLRELQYLSLSGTDLNGMAKLNNRISGHIPRWLGNLSQLSILVLRANYFEGEIPLEVTSIKTLQILDVSQNNLSGPIPHNLAKLTAMTHISQHTGFHLQNFFQSDYYYSEEVQITNKGETMSYTYGTILPLATYIDLSQNHLTGSIPSAIQELNGLITLNLSRNHLSGDIPDVFGIDMQLNSLDLSHNQLSGKVPVSLEFPGSLGDLNLSYNRLCGRILVVRHLDTFGEDSFVGNPCLCGPPLNTNCPPPPPATEDDEEDIEEEDETKNELLWYGGLLLSHAVGFWVMLVVLFFKRERRRKCLRVIDRVVICLLGRIGYW